VNDGTALVARPLHLELERTAVRPLSPRS
jgi:hypothetical protein